MSDLSSYTTLSLAHKAWKLSEQVFDRMPTRENALKADECWEDVIRAAIICDERVLIVPSVLEWVERRLETFEGCL